MRHFCFYLKDTYGFGHVWLALFKNWDKLKVTMLEWYFSLLFNYSLRHVMIVTWNKSGLIVAKGYLVQNTCSLSVSSFRLFAVCDVKDRMGCKRSQGMYDFISYETLLSCVFFFFLVGFFVWYLNYSLTRHWQFEKLTICPWFHSQKKGS